MKIYLSHPVTKDGDVVYQMVRPVGEVDWLDHWSFDCRPKPPNWGTGIVSVEGRRNAKEGDFPYATPGCLVMSSRARDALDGLVGDSVQRLPLETPDGKRFTLYYPPCSDCLDNERSVGVKLTSGRWLTIERYVFHADRVPTGAMFKASALFTKVFLRDEFKAAADAAGLVGLEYREIWNDDGGPVEVIRPMDRVFEDSPCQ